MSNSLFDASANIVLALHHLNDKSGLPFNKDVVEKIKQNPVKLFTSSLEGDKSYEITSEFGLTKFVPPAASPKSQIFDYYMNVKGTDLHLLVKWNEQPLTKAESSTKITAIVLRRNTTAAVLMSTNSHPDGALSVHVDGDFACRIPDEHSSQILFALEDLHQKHMKHSLVLSVFTHTLSQLWS